MPKNQTLDEFYSTFREEDFWIANSLNGRFQFISLTVDILNNLVSKQFERASILLGKVLFARCPKKPTIIY